jgi:hypothetical protein
MKDYGKIIAFSGIVVGIVSTLITLLLSFTQKNFGYFEVMKIAYIFVLLLIFAYVAVTNSFKSVYDEKKQADGKAKISILKYKPFTYLMIPNAIRGFCLGIVSIAVTIGYYHKCLDSFSASIIVIITNATTIVGCLVYSRISGRVKDRRIILITSIAVALFMPLMVLRARTLDFLIFYTVVNFFITIINYAVPVTVTKIADYDVIGQYSAGRMLLNTLGTSIAGIVCVPLFELMGVLATVTLAGCLQLLSGLGYYLYLKYYVGLREEKDI